MDKQETALELKDFEFELPPELIAQEPLAEARYVAPACYRPRVETALKACSIQRYSQLPQSWRHYRSQRYAGYSSKIIRTPKKWRNSKAASDQANHLICCCLGNNGDSNQKTQSG